MSGPELIVFDLDYTLWPFWVDTHHDPPFKLKNNKITDRSKCHVKCYPEVPELLKKLQEEGYKMALASRSTTPDAARELVRLFDWEKYFVQTEIYPGSKVQHFKKFHDKLGFPYSKMLFFDDEWRNIAEIGGLGATCFLVDAGVSLSVLKEGLEQYKAKQ